MPESPLHQSAYQVLGVADDVDEETLKKAYRRMLRHTHPDTGGDAKRFLAVQLAWEEIGTPEARAVYDRRRTGGPSAGSPSWGPQAPRPRRDSRPQTRSQGYPGGWYREHYLAAVRDWLGRGGPEPTVEELYSPAVVQRAPQEVRRLLAEALAEEASARLIAPLGLAYSVWHDVVVDEERRSKLDHLLLGPTGLIGIASEDYGSPVTVKQGELRGEGLAYGEEPLRELALKARTVARAARVKLTALIIVIPDEAHPDSLTPLGRVKGVPGFLVHRSRLAGLLRMGVTGDAVIGGGEIFEVRTRLQQSVRLLE